MTKSCNIEGHDVLTRCVAHEAAAEIRISPFAASPDRDAKPVLSIIVEGATFDVGVVEPLLGREFECEVFDKHVVLIDTWHGTEICLEGSKVTAVKVAYDIEDHQAILEGMIAEYEDIQARLMKANATNAKGAALVEELLRRAQIKSTTSDDLAKRQAAAIEVLKRLQGHFGS